MMLKIFSVATLARLWSFLTLPSAESAIHYWLYSVQRLLVGDFRLHFSNIVSTSFVDYI